MIRLVQLLDENGARRVGVSSDDPVRIRVLSGFDRTYDLAREALHSGAKLETLARSCISTESVDYDRAIAERRLLARLDHADPARCTVSLTSLTHLGSAKSRDQMHAAVATGKATDPIRMFQIGIEGGKPRAGEIGAEPEWAYKGDGRCIVPPSRR